MNPSLSKQQPLTSKAALEWLQSIVGQSGESDDYIEVDEAMGEILECDWSSDEEYLEFFKEISTELARSATLTHEEETACLFSTNQLCVLDLDSPYYRLWERAVRSESLLLKEEISLEEWDTCLDSGITLLPLLALLPLATAYEDGLFKALRQRAIKSLSPEQEQFMCYVVSMLSSGYFEGEIPLEIIYAPSPKVLAEIFYDWTSLAGLWLPHIVKEALASEHADSEVREQIAAHLRYVDVADEDSWREHLDFHWSDADIEEILQLCE